MGIKGLESVVRPEAGVDSRDSNPLYFQRLVSKSPGSSDLDPTESRKTESRTKYIPASGYPAAGLGVVHGTPK